MGATGLQAARQRPDPHPRTWRRRCALTLTNVPKTPDTKARILGRRRPPPPAQPPGLRCRQIALSAPLRPPPFRLARSSPSPSGTDLQTSLRQETNVRAHRQGGCELRGAASGGCANVPAHAVEAAAASPSTLTTQLRPRMRRPDANRLGGQETRDPLHHVTAPSARHKRAFLSARTGGGRTREAQKTYLPSARQYTRS